MCLVVKMQIRPSPDGNGSEVRHVDMQTNLFPEFSDIAGANCVLEC